MTNLCGNEEWLAAYLDKRLSEEERHLYETHLSDCQGCLAELIAAKTELAEMATAEACEALPGPFVAGRIEKPHGEASTARRPLDQVARRMLAPGAITASFSAALALILAAGLFLLMRSPGWDPDYIAGKSNLRKILATTDIGAMRLSRGPGSPLVQTAHYRGIEESREALFARTATQLQNAGSRYPNDWQSFALLGDLSLAAGQIESAEAYYDKALGLHQGDAQLLNDRAVAEYRRGNIELSRQLLEEALKADDAHPQMLYNLAVLCELLGERDSMKHYIEIYLQQDSSSPWADRARALLAE